MKIDIIIPVKEINPYIYESIPRILELNYEDFNILIFPDRDTGESFPKTRIIPTGDMGPAQKRNMALKHSEADILAFLDDDAYPRADWLQKALRHFCDPEVGAVGGPAVTPPDNSFLQKVSGAVFLSRLGGGYPERYWPVGRTRTVDDWPSVNLLVRRDVFEKVGGFNSKYWPGEDTKLCLDIVQGGYKIMYDPEVYVWHHRREGLERHLRQTGRYGLHRGFFAKALPETSRRFNYFLPSMLAIFILSGGLLPIIDSAILYKLYTLGLVLYTSALIFASYEIYAKERNILVTLVSSMYIVCTHVWYGLRFIQGFLFTKDLKSKLRK